MTKIFRILRRPLVIGLIAALLVGGGVAYAFLGGDDAPTFVTVTAERGTVREEVSVVGRIRSTERLDLGLEGIGKVAVVTVAEGDRVYAGQTLVSLSSSDLAAQLRAAEAGVTRERASLDRLLAGASDADRAVSSAGVDSAASAVGNAEENLRAQLAQGYVSVDSALGTGVDRLFTNPRTAPSFGIYISQGSTSFFIGSQSDKSRLNDEQEDAVRLLQEWRDELASGDVDDALRAAEAATSQMRVYLTDLASVINGLRPDSTTDQTIYESYKAGVASARSAASAAASSISGAKQAVASAEASLALSRSQLGLKVAPAQSADVAIQRASIASAEAQVSLVRSQIGKNVVVSPVDGIAVTVSAAVGEIASGPVVTVIADAPLEIEAQVPEADIAKIEVGNEARVSLDAYPGKDFSARVIYVADAEVEVEGVPTYKVRLQIQDDDGRLKPGMTADLDISTETREDVIAIPQRAVISRDGQKVVRIEDGEVSREVTVRTGIRGTDGRIEIVEGLKEGDLVIVSSSEEQ